MTEALRVIDWSQAPLGSLVIAILLVPAWSWELDTIELDIASRGGFLSYYGLTSLPIWVLMPLLCDLLVSTKESIW